MAVTTIAGNEPKAPAKVYTLNTTHRCDRCGAQAYVDVTLRSGLNLLFCGHHFDRMQKALAPEMKSFLDERDRLVENRHQGSAN